MQHTSSARTGRAGRAVARAVRAPRHLTRVLRRVRARFTALPGDAGLATAEYAVVMIAAVGFAGLLVVILRSPEIRETLTSLVRDALSV